MDSDAGGFRGTPGSARRAVHWRGVTAQHAKQVLKNGLYRALGESSAALRLDPNGETTLRVLMYHKINDIPDNPTSVPVGLFDEQLAQAKDSGYEFVDLDAVLDHFVEGAPLPRGATL